MSDTSNPANLASADDFDARLKRTDVGRWLATRYAPAGARERLVALYLVNQEFQRALHAKEAMLGKIRIQWWRETLEQFGGGAPARRHDLAEELARVTQGRPDLLAAMRALIDAYDAVLDDHLQAGGHHPSEQHEARHLAVEAALMRLAGLALAEDAGEPALRALANAGEARVRLAAGLTGAEAAWASAKVGLANAPATLWPAVLHLAVTGSEGPSAMRWRVFLAALRRRL